METKILERGESRLLRIQKIQHRLAVIPREYREIYEKAVNHNDKDAAIKAFCLECVGWRKDEVINCTSVECPLYGVRPYKKGTENEEE